MCFQLLIQRDNIFLNIYSDGARVRFEPEVVREEEFRNTQEPIEEVFDEAGRSSVLLLWAALARKFGKQRRRRRRWSKRQR